MSFGFSVGDILTIIETFNRTRKNWVDAPEEYKAIVDELETLRRESDEPLLKHLVRTKSLSNILRDLEDVIERVDLTARQQEDLKHAKTSCIAVLHELDAVEKKYVELGKKAAGFRGHTRRAWMRWKAEPEDIRNLRSRLMANVTLLTPIYVSINANLTRENRDHVAELLGSNVASERESIANWFGPRTFAEQHNDLLSRRGTGTGQWLLDSPQYQAWITCHIPTLICPGIPGSGKTMMAAIVIDDLHSRFGPSEDIAIVYHYCDYNRRNEQRLTDFLAASVRQLFQEQQTVPKLVKTLYERHKDRQTRPSTEELRQLMLDLSVQYTHVFIVIDALDECRNDDLTRDEFLRILFEGQVRSKSSLQILSTSRPIPQITDYFCKGEQLEIRASTEDVSRYLDGEMGRLSCAAGHADLQKSIKDSIISAVEGMFLLAKLHFDSLTDKTKPRAVRNALTSLAKGSEALFVAYQNARERIDAQPRGHRNLACRVLSFITYTERALRIEELRHALGIECGMDDIDPKEDCEKESLLLAVCAGLVIVDPESRLVRLVHYTTQEYLRQIGSDWFPNGRLDMARSCLAYLSMAKFSSGWVESSEAFKHRLELYPFLDHGARFWGKYVSETSDPNVIEPTRSFLNSRGLLASATQAMLAEKSKYDESYNWGPKNVTALHVVAYFGLKDITESILDQAEPLNAKDSNGATPITWAARNAHREVVKLLLAQDGIEINTQDNYGQTPLSWAAEKGQGEVVKLLLAQDGIEINTQDKGGRTPLSWATVKGKGEVVKLLLAQDGIEINTEDNYGQTPLSWAAEKGQGEVVKLLLAQDGIEINTQDNYGRTPLSWATQNGQGEVVKLLLAQDGIEINTQDNYGQTPLSWLREWPGRSVKATTGPGWD